MFRHVPNAITGSRLLLAAAFFVLLSLYQHNGQGDPHLLDIAFVVYVVALVSDFLDGYLARRWKVEGAFGRMVDPFVDKVLVLGTFIYFGGKNFVIQAGGPQPVLQTISGVRPWMVVLMLARELLVTSLRGVGEASGANFGAAYVGKLKMVFQSGTILVILLYVNYFQFSANWQVPAQWFRDICIWLTVAFTLYSGIAYVRKGVALYQSRPPDRGDGSSGGLTVRV
jgi:CDP-diacylglycerol--glycerol-3-phosphate 3-phosphatidyltransferase